MVKLRIYSLLLLLLATASSSLSQGGLDTLTNVIRPRIGLGVGTMTYYGEVQNYQKGFVPMVNRYYGIASINAPITKYFNLEFSASYGKIAANERSLTKNLNFESRIRMASFQLFYNFYPLFTLRRSLFHPFVGIGFSSFEFLSKSDLYDANGNQYHYWSDGSIMNMVENDPLATTAIALNRDYAYETDLREQNLDGLGKYKEQSFSVPLSAGMEFHLSPRWDFRIATTFHLTFTDLIDNITPAGQGAERHGDSKNDRLWTTYVSLSYDLWLPEEEFFDLFDDNGVELYAKFENEDWDGDGIIDALDECPGTPLEALVDNKGCPLDGDKDGVPDYKDDEPSTPKGNFVDEFGITMSEQHIAKHWKEYNDSTGYDHEFIEDRKVIEFGKISEIQLIDPYPHTKNKSYVIIIGREQKDVAANDLHKYLGFNNFKTELRGDTVYYTLGEYKKIEDAVGYANVLEEQGIGVELIGRDGSNDSTFFEVDQKVVDKVNLANLENGVEPPVIGKSEVQLFRVQIGAFKKKISPEKEFPGLKVTYASSSDGITRYYVGNHNNYPEANIERKKLISKGYRSAFIVAYENEKRKTLKELGINPKDLPDNYNEESELSSFVEPRDTSSRSNHNIVNGIDMSKVKYRVKFATYAGTVPTVDLDILFNIGGVKPVRELDGSTTYYSKKFVNFEEVQQAMIGYETYGLGSMEPTVEYNGEYFTVEQFDRKLKP